MTAIDDLTGFTTVTWDDAYLSDADGCLAAGCTLFNYLDDGGDNKHYLMVWLQGQDSVFNDWSASIDAEDSADRTENEKTYQYDYSGYVLAMRCNIEIIDG